MNTVLDSLFCRHEAVKVCEEQIRRAYDVLYSAFSSGNKLLACGNGGSAADCEHLVGELMKGFLSLRPLSAEARQSFCAQPDGDYLASHLQGALPAVSLVSQTGLMTAFANDVDAELIFAQQVYGYMKPGDVLVALSTSGNSRNVVLAARTAHACGGKVIALTGESGGQLNKSADVCIRLPASEPFAVQELTLPVYHALAAALEAAFFGK